MIEPYELNNEIDKVKDFKDNKAQVERAKEILASWEALPSPRDITLENKEPFDKSIVAPSRIEYLKNLILFGGNVGMLKDGDKGGLLASRANQLQDPAWLQEIDKKELRTIRAGDRLLQGVPEQKWLIQYHVPAKGIVILGGASGSYKSWSALGMAISVSIGKDYLDQFTTTQANVLYIDEENGDITLTNRLSALMQGLGLEPEQLNNIHLSIFNNVKLDAPLTSKHALKKLIEQTGAKLIILDSMVRLMEGDEDRSTDVRRIFETLKELLKDDEDLAFVIIHHTSKAVRKGLNSLRGSSDFSAFADVVIIYDGRKGYSLVEIVKNRHVDLSEQQPYIIKLVQENTGLKPIWLPQNEALGLIEACAELIKTSYTDAGIKIFQTKQAKEWASNEGYKPNTINNALKKLVEEGDLVKQKQGIYKIVGASFTEEKLQDYGV